MAAGVREGLFSDSIASERDLDSFKARLPGLLHAILIGVAEDGITNHPVGAEAKIRETVVLPGMEPHGYAQRTVRENDVAAGRRCGGIDLDYIKSLGHIGEHIFAVRVRECRQGDEP